LALGAPGRIAPRKELPLVETLPPRTLLSVVVPVWNGEHNLGRLLPRLDEALAGTVSGPTEVIVALPADDPARPLAEGLGARVLSFAGSGYGAALRAGLGAAAGAWVVTMDADFSHHPEFIRTLWLR